MGKRAGLSTAAVLGCLLVTGAFPARAHARRQTPPAVAPADPVRKVELAPVASRSFQLPNGQRAQLDVYLQDLVRAALAQTPNLRALEPGSAGGPGLGQCGRHLVLETQLTAIQLDVNQFGFSFG